MNAINFGEANNFSFVNSRLIVAVMYEDFPRKASETQMVIVYEELYTGHNESATMST